MGLTILGTAASDYFDPQLLRTGESRNLANVGVWLGKLVRMLGLGNHCEHREFHALAAGRHPFEPRRLRPRDSAIDHLSVLVTLPLSLSLVALVDPRIVVWFTEAIIEEFAAMEACARIRNQGKGSKVRPGQRAMATGLVAALFVHFSSRKLEPCLHAHLMVMNLTCADGIGWRALTADELYRCQALFNHAILARLAYKLVAAGYRLEPRKDGYEFEVAGVPESLFSLFGSSRRAILAGLPAGIEDPNERRYLSDKLAIGKRAPKRADAELIVNELSLARVPEPEKRALGALVSEARTRSAAGVAIPPLDDTRIEFQFSTLGVFEKRWVATDVELIVGAFADHWGDPGSIDLWHRELHAANLPALGDHFFGSAYDVQALRLLRELRLPSVTVRPSIKSDLDALRSGLEAGGNGAVIVAKDPAKSLLAQKLPDCRCVSLAAFASGAPLFAKTAARSAIIEISGAAELRPCLLLDFAKRCAHLPMFALAFVGNADDADKIAAKTMRAVTQPVNLDVGTPPLPGRHFRVDGAATELARFERVIEVPDRSAWPDLVAHQVADSFQSGLRHYVAGSEADAATFTMAIRAEFDRRELLTGPERLMTRLRRVSLTDGERTSASSYAAGMVLECAECVPGFNKGDRVTVRGSAATETGLEVVDAEGQGRLLKLADCASFACFVRDTLSLRVGDVIQLTAVRSALATRRLTAHRPYRVVGIEKDGSLLVENGAQLDPKYGHLDHGYFFSIRERESRRFAGGMMLLDTAEPDPVGPGLRARLRGVGTTGPLNVLCTSARLLAQRLGVTLVADACVSLKELFARSIAGNGLLPEIPNPAPARPASPSDLPPAPMARPSPPPPPPPPHEAETSGPTI